MAKLNVWKAGHSLELSLFKQFQYIPISHTDIPSYSASKSVGRFKDLGEMIRINFSFLSFKKNLANNIKFTLP